MRATALVATFALAVVTPTAHAAPRPVVVSGRSPLVGCPGDASMRDSEYDQKLARLPSDARRLVAVWTQDDAGGTVTSTSTDGGRTWSAPHAIPGLTVCTGGTDLAAFDPWVSVGADGRAYASSGIYEGGLNPLQWALKVATSGDGGRTWTAAAEITRPAAVVVDWPTITADPSTSGRAWVVWTEIQIPEGNSLSYMSSTTDGGATWTRPGIIAVPVPGRANFMSQVHVLPDRSLVHVWIDFPAQPAAPIEWIEGTIRLLSARSSDDGATWSAPVVGAEIAPSVLRDPDTGAPLARGIFFPPVSSTSAPDGSLHACWTDAERGTVFVASSADGGTSWTSELIADVGAATFTCTVAAREDGTAVSFYDFRDDRPADGELTTGVWLAVHERSGWTHSRLGGPFDLHATHAGGGSAHPHGDAFGLVATEVGYVATFNQAAPLAQSGLTDVFAARVNG